MQENTARYTVNLRVNAQQALDNVEELRRRLAKMRKEQADAASKGQAYSGQKELDQTERALRRAEREAQGFKKVLDNLSAAKPKEIKDAIKEINRQLNSNAVERGSAQWQALQQLLADCKDELKGIRDEAKEAPGALDGLAASWRQALSLDGLKQRVADALSPGAVVAMAEEAIRAYTSMDAAMAETRKYTGQTADEVLAMNEDFKRLDTRTSREQLNALAGAAGRLGITATEAIEEFVDAADKISVALGDDLGEGAIDSIGKLAQMFGEADTLGLRGAMLATGSAVNDLAQSSSANAGYIVDFTADLSGVGKMAGFTQTQLMGLASALDQNMQEEATSSTVFSQLITKMYQDPAKFAQIAGKQVEEFTTLLKTDANAALLQFLQTMQDKGGFADMAPMFESMNLNGTRAVGVLSAVASHLDQVREAQRLAADSYEEAESVTNEFNVQNTTAEATLDKLQGRVRDLQADLGALLWPAVEEGVGIMQALVGAAGAILSFASANRAALASLAVAVAAYNAQALIAAARVRVWYAWELLSSAALRAKAAVVATARAAWLACTVGVRSYTAALQAARAASLTNPFTALLTVVAGLGAALLVAARAFRTEAAATEEAKDAAQALADVRQRAAQTAAQEKARVEQLTGIIHSNAYSIQQRMRAVQALRAIIPAYTAELSAEGEVTRENTAAVDDYIRKLDQLALAKAVAAKKEELAKAKVEAAQRKEQTAAMRRAIDSEERANPSKYAYRPTYLGSSTAGGVITQDANADARRALERQREEWREKDEAADRQLRKIEAQNRALDEQIKKSAEVKEAVVAAATAAPSAAAPSAAAPSAAKPQAAKPAAKADSYEADLRAERDFYKQRQAITAEATEREGLNASQAYDLQAADLQAHYERLLDIQRKWGRQQDQATLAQASSEAMKLTEQYVKADEQERREAMEAATEADRRQEDAEATAAARAYLDGQASYEDYQRRLDLIAYEHAKARAAIMAEQGFSPAQEEQKALQHDVRAKQEADTASKATATAALESSLDGASAAEQLALIAQAEEQGVLTHEEAERRKTQATQQQATLRAQLQQQSIQQVSQLLQAAASFYAAQSQLEQAQITKKYDAEIEAAGSSTAKGKRLEEKKQQELAKVKSKYNKKQMKIEIAQAIASGALAAINAYASAAKVSFVLAPIAAGMAAAATALQIATIVKQHKAEEAGYYEGGFTPGRNFRRRAGVVHEGEFVISHQALASPAVMAVARAIDQAQRTNAAAALTTDDVAAALPATRATAAASPSAAAALTTAAESAQAAAPSAAAASSAAAESPAAAPSAQALAQAIERLNDQLAAGITAVAAIDGPQGVYKQLRHFQRLRGEI